MLLFNARHKRRYQASGAPLFLALVLVMAGVLGGCGFRPLYGTGETQALAAEQSLALIEIEPIKDRIGQQLRNNLLSRLNPKRQPERPLYSLSVALTESIANLGVKKSAVVTRGNLRVSANYSLSSLSGTLADGDKDVKLTSGRVISTSSYDIPQAQYAALAAQKDARTRAVREIADDIRTRLAVYFLQNADKQ